jgi:glycosyltransferase involved in cell wall biosynthesis
VALTLLYGEIHGTSTTPTSVTGNVGADELSTRAPARGAVFLRVEKNGGIRAEVGRETLSSMQGIATLRVGDSAPVPPQPHPEEHIVRNWPDGAPAVSVLCPTFNHVSFIEQAINGFLCQQTTFRYEVLIRDDASTDGTREIIEEYATRYPSIIRPILESENRFPHVMPGRVLRSLAKGRYAAYCEGDDYWIDPLKLQRQFDALERDASAVVSHHQTVVVQDGVIVSLGQLPQQSCRDFSGRELTEGAWILSSSRFYRNVDIPANRRNHPLTNGDRYLSAQLGLYGGAIFEPDLVSVYRLHKGGVWSPLDHTERKISQATSFFLLGQQFGHQSHLRLKRLWYRRALWRLAGVLFSPRILIPREFRRVVASVRTKYHAYWEA